MAKQLTLGNQTKIDSKGEGKTVIALALVRKPLDEKAADVKDGEVGASKEKIIYPSMVVPTQQPMDPRFFRSMC